MCVSVAVKKLHKQFVVTGRWIYYCMIVWRQQSVEMG